MLHTLIRLAAGTAFILASWPALAAPRTWVASFGNGATCSRAAPCADFATAYLATDDGGEINCLDAGGDATFGGLSIRKSITIDCTGTASPAKSSGDIIIDVPGIVVILRNLAITTKDDLNGGGLGVWVLAGSALHVENCASRISSSGRPEPRSESSSPPAPVPARCSFRTQSSPTMA